MAEHIHHTAGHRAIFSTWFWPAILAAPLVVRFLFALIDAQWWGLNHLAFAPVYYVIILASLSALALLWIMLQPLQSQHSSRIEQVCSFLVSNRGAALAALAGGVTFWLMSSNSHLFAIGYERIGNLVQRTTPFVHEYEYLATQLTVALYQLTAGISDRALDDAALVFRITSVLSGAGCIWLWLLIIARLGKTHLERVALFAFLFFGGAATLFFGAGELQAPAVFYSSLLIWLSLTAVQSTEKPERLKYALVLALCAASGPLYLAQLVFFIPPICFILGIALFPGGRRERVWGALFLGALVALVFYVYQLGSENMWTQARLALPGGKPPEFNYNLLSLSRFFDLANSGLFLWPMAPALFWLCLRYFFFERADHLASCLGALAIAAAVWIFIADFPGGAVREVTTLAPFSIPALVLAGYLWNKSVIRGASVTTGRKLTGALLVTSVASFLSIVPAMYSVEGSVRYIDHDYQRRSERYLSGLINFRDHFFFVKDFPTADHWEQNFKSKSPVYLDHESVLALVRVGQHTAALRRLEFLLATHPHWAPLRATQARVYLSLGRLTEALVSISKARELSPDSYTYLIHEGDIWRALEGLGAADSARVRYETAYRWVNDDPEALMRMGMMAYEGRRFEQARRFAYLLYESDFSNVYSYLIIGLIAYQDGEVARARAYLSYMQRVAPNIPEAALVNGLLEKLKN